MTSDTTPLKIAVVIASSRPNRVGPAVAAWVMEATAQRGDATYELIDLAEQDLPNLDEPQPASSGNYTKDHTKAWAQTVDRFDGFIIVTPEYNRSIPGQLKNAIDFLYAEWNDKAAGIVCYGSAGGLRAAEVLKVTLGEVQIATVRAQCAISIFDDMRDFTEMAPRDFQAKNLQETFRQTERWARALSSLRLQ